MHRQKTNWLFVLVVALSVYAVVATGWTYWHVRELQGIQYMFQVNQTIQHKGIIALMRQHPDVFVFKGEQWREVDGE